MAIVVKTMVGKRKIIVDFFMIEIALSNFATTLIKVKA